MGFAQPWTETKVPEMRLGTVLVFKKNITKEQAEKIIEALEPALSYSAGVNEYDASYGSGPVWYIP